KQDHDRVIIQSGNLEVVRDICDKNNQEADALTKMTFENDEDLRMFDVPPMKIQVVLKEDRVKGILAPVTSI
ncbi:hypothetical protein Golob_026491, partial [Gossypium lobatum]|nr:hypothetical protein [Gossypium lobatum]